MKLPKIGPKLAPAPTNLDEDSMERLDQFIWMAADSKVINTRRLLWLAVVFSGPLRLRYEHSPKDTGETVMLTPHTVVMTSQEHVGVAKVNYYLTQMWDGEPVKAARVTDGGQEVGWWHLDGLHRLLAARILGQDLEGRILR